VTFPPALPLRLVIFDCDGVLVDSEGPSNRAVAEEVTKLGWPMDEAESTRRFVGFQLEQIAPVVEAHTGRPVPDGWVELVRRRLVDVLADELELVSGVREVLQAVDAMGLPCRVASNSSQLEMRVKFARTGLLSLLARSHSAYEVARGKPAPDVFLAAAAAEGVPAGACVVVEDSVTGANAAAAAGMACVGLDPHGDGLELRAAGATVIRSLLELPPMLREASVLPLKSATWISGIGRPLDA
jgi:HAD superfamily hydrolase (TIGR01509 family)